MDMIFQGLIYELIPSVAAVIDEIVVRPENAVRKSVVALELCQMFSTGLSSGDFWRHDNDGDVGCHD